MTEEKSLSQSEPSLCSTCYYCLGCDKVHANRIVEFFKWVFGLALVYPIGYVFCGRTLDPIKSKSWITTK